MDEHTEKPTPQILKALQGSGSPFQTAVAQVISSVKGWFILKSEYPWRGPENDDRFLDIVAANHRFTLAVECKKTKDSYIFLRPLAVGSNARQVENFRCPNVKTFEPPFLDVVCETWNLWPQSPSCEFCVVSGNSGGSQRLLEKDASILVNAADAYSKDGHEVAKRKTQLPYLVLPVIVTNAKLYTARYNPSEISLESGEFEDWPHQIEENVPWDRFTKTFIAGQGHDFGSRSVFVINSMSLKEFLDNLEEAPTQLIGKTPVSIA